MFIRLLLLFTIVPLIELYVIMKVGSRIGALPTIALLILTGFAGAWLARSQGFALLHRIQSELAAGRLPTSHLLDGAIVLAGGILLLTPGFCTDILGLILLVPFSRSIIKHSLKLWLQRRINRGTITIRRL